MMVFVLNLVVVIINMIQNHGSLTSILFQHAVHQLTIKALFKLQVFLIEEITRSFSFFFFSETIKALFKLQIFSLEGRHNDQYQSTLLQAEFPQWKVHQWSCWRGLSWHPEYGILTSLLKWSKYLAYSIADNLINLSGKTSAS